ncbi:MAG: penicillin-binding protein 2 [Patescibacteria group bacterium]|nr:penicillin-binding protein 2 [Patescibacteria group bacterium]
MRLKRPLFNRHRTGDRDETAIRYVMLRWLTVAVFAVIVGRLFILQVISHGFYAALAIDQHGIYEQLFPQRGTVYLHDPDAAGGIFPVAVNKTLTLVFADGRRIKDATEAAKSLAPLLGLDEAALKEKLSQANDPYVPLQHRVLPETADKIRALNLDGIQFSEESFRFYPEKESACHITGFVGSGNERESVGRYGVEGRWDRELTGDRGVLEGERGQLGQWIGAASRVFQPAKDGADVILTIDRNIQYVACRKLKEAVAKHGADGGALVIIDPKTGAVLAMCGVPDYDPNDYAAVTDMRAFNNPAIYFVYEPGSVFKPFTLAAAIDAGKIAPNTSYEDTGAVKIGGFTIRNSDGKANGWQTMTQVLEKSLNTGTIFAVRQLGAEDFRRYVEQFGFGTATGVELDYEAAGSVDALANKGDIWSATGSFGQGITVTPLQLAAAYGALANGGKLMKTHVVSEVRGSDGLVKRVEPTAVRQVVSQRTAGLVAGMLASVVENGHGKRAGVPGYYVAGKTGTAQIPRKDGRGYETEVSIGSFAGFAPVDDPAFAMVVVLDRPRDVEWAESSAAPLFGDIAKYLLQYMKIPPTRAVAE